MKNSGFTLFELLVSVSIIGILTALATVSYSTAQKRARDTRRIQDMQMLQKAEEQYYSLNSYNYMQGNTSVGSTWAVNGQTILESFPRDPKGSDWTQYLPTFGTGTYCFCATMENQNNGNSASQTCATGIGASGPYYCVKNQQ